MPKMKSNRAASKRFKMTGSGRVRRAKAGKSHLMRGKSGRRLRRLKKNDMVKPSHEAHIQRLLPYGN
jgi:large subunit ribosomal protein L35